MPQPPAGRADNQVMLVGMQGRVVHSAAAVRRLPAPASPPPGPLDAVIGMLLARAAPFDPATQLAIRQQQGWAPKLPPPSRR